MQMGSGGVFGAVSRFIENEDRLVLSTAKRATSTPVLLTALTCDRVSGPRNVIIGAPTGPVCGTFDEPMGIASMLTGGAEEAEAPFTIECIGLAT